MTFQNSIVIWIVNRKFEKILNSKSRTGFESVRQSPKGLQKWLLFCVGSTSATKITGILQELPHPTYDWGLIMDLNC